jgi:Mg2+-importing ATPase
MGTHVVSGGGHALVVRTGRTTEFGRISERLRLRPAETEFERGVRRFGVFLMEITLLLVLAIFAVNVYLAKPILDSFLFALALAVGLSPQLLPAIISVNLAKGAKAMAGKQVIVKRLTAIENFGSMDVLCCDKTGTLTQGVVHVHSAVDASGAENDRVLFHAYLNASFQTGFSNPIDTAIRSHRPFDLTGWARLDEVPYDFVRKRLSVLASNGDRTFIVTKGSIEAILSICTASERGGRRDVPIEEAMAAIRNQYSALSSQGFRTIAVAVRDMAGARAIRRDDEQQLTFLGLIVLHDPLKPDVGRTIAALNRLGISLKMITGDNVLVATEVARSVGLDRARILTGSDLNAISDEALPARAADAGVFAEIEPNQKERIIHALRKAGHVTGFMGDGINDGPALHAADVSISVQQAVDVAKAAADIVLLQSDLTVLEDGVREGRKTFANTLKYVFMATSANFGNMFSMAGASLFLSFLPLLPKQILLTNLLTDFPELSIATDRVDDEWIARPHRWNIRFIREFMIVFGALSSVFDYLTFGVLLWWLHTGPPAFRTGWFLESVISATLIVLVVRTRGSALGSRPSRLLLAATLLVVAGTLALPFSTLGRVFGFVAVPAAFIGPMSVIIVLYILSAELVKRWFYRRIASGSRGI